MDRTLGLRVGVMPAADPTGVARAAGAVRRAHPRVAVELTQSWGSPAEFASVRDGDLDALVLVGPVDYPGLDVSVLGCRDRHAVVAADHPLADKAVVRLEDVVDLPTFRRPDDVLPSWRTYWLNVEERGHEPRYRGRSGSEFDALLAIGGGTVVGVAPRGWGRVPGLVSRWVRDLAPVPLVAVTRPGLDGRPLACLLHALRAGSAEALSLAETRVAALVAEGWSDREIAERLCLSPRTVESQVASARRRLGLRSRAHLAAYAASQAR